MQKTTIKNDIDFNIPSRAELITRKEPDTSVGGFSFGFDLMYTENSAERLSTEEGSKLKNLQGAYTEELEKPIKVLLTKFFNKHPEIIPATYVSMAYTTNLGSYKTRAELCMAIRETGS